MTQTTSSNYFCHVCGAPLGDFAPWGEDGLSPTHGICDCCGVEYGYEDYNLSSLITFKANWLSSGGQWKNPKAKPMGLSLERQLQCVPDRPPAGVRLIERPSSHHPQLAARKCVFIEVQDFNSEKSVAPSLGNLFSRQKFLQI